MKHRRRAGAGAGAGAAPPKPRKLPFHLIGHVASFLEPETQAKVLSLNKDLSQASSMTRRKLIGVAKKNLLNSIDSAVLKGDTLHVFTEANPPTDAFIREGTAYLDNPFSYWDPKDSTPAVNLAEETVRLEGEGKLFYEGEYDNAEEKAYQDILRLHGLLGKVKKTVLHTKLGEIRSIILQTYRVENSENDDAWSAKISVTVKLI